MLIPSASAPTATEPSACACSSPRLSLGVPLPALTRACSTTSARAQLHHAASPAPLLHLHLHRTHTTHTHVTACNTPARCSSNALPQLRHVPRACAQQSQGKPSYVQVTTSEATQDLFGKSLSPFYDPQRVRTWPRPFTTIRTAAMPAAIEGFPLIYPLVAVSLGMCAESATSTPFDGDKVLQK